MGEKREYKFSAEEVAEIERVSEILSERLDYMCLMDDYYFTAFMQDNAPCMQVILRAFTGDGSIEVTGVTAQYVVSNGADGRGVRYDCRVETTSGTIYNLEVEKNPSGALELRLRYYSEMLDKENLKKNDDFNKLPPVVNIVIMPKDIRKQGKPLYYVRRTYVESLTEIGDNPEFFDDKMAFIYVNALYKDRESLIGRVIHDFTTNGTQEKLVKEIDEATKRFLCNEEGRRKMSTSIASLGLAGKDLEHLLSDTERAQIHKQGLGQGERIALQFLLDNGLVDKVSLEKLYKNKGRFLPKLETPYAP